MRTTRFLLSALILVAACDADILSPNLQPLSASATARADAFTLSTTAQSPSTISLWWNDLERDELGWEVHRSTTGAAGSFTLRATFAANATTHTDSGLTMLTAYCYKVRPYKRQGTRTAYGAFSNTSCASTLGPPRAATNVNAVPRNSTWVDVTWTNSDGSALRVERAAASAGPWETAATYPYSMPSSYTEPRPAEEQICYRVVTINAFGETPSTADCTALPHWVSSISAASTDAHTIDVTWTDASNVEDGYEVQRAVNDTVFTAVANLAANASSYHDGGVVANTTYYYRVRPKRDGGFGTFGLTVSAAVPTAPPPAPTALNASPGGSTRAVVTWASLPASVTGVRVQRSTDAQANWADAASVTGGQATFTDTARTPEQQVCYRAFAFNALGESGPSSVDCTAPPLSPANVTFDHDEYGMGLLSWTDRSNVEEGYVIRILAWCGYCRYRDITVGPNETSVWIGLDDGESVELYAYADGGLSDLSWSYVPGAAPVTANSLLMRKAPRP